MFKRLFPAALTVIVVSMGAALLWLPEHRWIQTAKEVIASALYFENWQLAADSTDYFAQHSSASIMQHFWSLSVQGQFYLVWPLLIGFLMLLARPFRWSMRATLITTLSLIFAVSLAYSVWLTAVNQPFAYFSSLTRVWEFALGGLLALTIDRIVLPRWLAVVCGWLGVIGLASCGLVLQVGTMFPGYVALWPMVSALLVLVAGATGSRVGADRFLSSRPLIYLGNISYSLYLWHWPVLLFYLVVRGQSEVGLLGGAGVIGLSVVLAVLTYHGIENPVRYSQIGVTTRWGAYRFAALVLVPVLGAAIAWQYIGESRAKFEFRIEDSRYPGAQALAMGEPLYDPDNDVVPPFAAVSSDWTTWRPGECVRIETEDDSNARECRMSPPEGVEPQRRVAVAGDSHTWQLASALIPIAREENWELTSFYRPGCPLTATTDPELVKKECAQWNREVLPKIIDLHPDVLITMGTRNVRVGLTERTPDGYVEQWRRLAEHGIRVLAVRDNPRFDYQPPECVQLHGLDAPECGRPRSELYHVQPPWETAGNVPADTAFVDLSDYFCTPAVCPPVVGNVLVYVDDNHVTQTYMKTLAPILKVKMLDALGWEPLSAAAPK